MSSMVAKTLVLSLLISAAIPVAACGQTSNGSEWDQARRANAANSSAGMAYAVSRWRQLSASPNFSFSEYASFIQQYPSFPDEDKLRRYAEAALERTYADPRSVIALFDRAPPLSNPARAQYALALRALARPEAATVAKAAWRGGAMSDGNEAALLAAYSPTFTPADHDARMDALLWAGATAQAQRQLAYVSPARRILDGARLAAAQGMDPASVGLSVPATANSDAGYVFNRARQLRRSGQTYASVALLANRPRFTNLPADQAEWVEELLVQARAADARSAVKIASKIDDGFAPGTDISRLGFGLRDDYTSLMWLGGTKAMWDLGDGATAAPLFYRYGAAAKTPQTRSKGFYWAGRASTRAGDTAGATRYYTLASQYSDQFYGLLARERLGLPVPNFAARPVAVPTPDQRRAFNARPLTQAVREVARGAEWQTTVRFFKQIAEVAESEADHVMVAELARDIGRRDLGVILGNAAGADGYMAFHHVAFPLIPVPPGYNSSWTAIHAVTRQESQFAQNAISHAGASGLMQLMPGTAREQAGKMGLGYSQSALITDPNYNIQLGSAYFSRMMDYFGGSWPLAIAAYNAGAGNVNKFLRANGDPRNGGVDWIDWIERIPLSETRNYVQRVIENAVVYEAMYPDKATHRGPNPTSRFIGKRTAG